MIKRIVILTLVLVLTGAVGVAAYDAYQGNSSLELPDVSSLAKGQGQQGQGNGKGQGQQGQGNSQGQQGQGNGKGQGQQGQGQQGGHGNGSGEPVEHEWITLSGNVVSVDQQRLTVNTSDQEEVVFNLGRPGFSNEQNVIFNPGDAVTVQGFDSPEGMLVAGAITNDTTGETLHLRDPNGRPLWAGQGQGQGQGGQGGGQGHGKNGQGQGGQAQSQ